MQRYLVGGAVRDSLLGLAVTDRDWVVVGARPEDMRAAGYVLKDPQFQVYSHPETGEEHALARRERKAGSGHRGFRLDFDPSISLEEDLRRRDLTINAMAMDDAGNLRDPFRGHADLAARVLRMVTPAFREDPLRVWRAARFSAHLGAFEFGLEANTLETMRAMTDAPEFASISAQRIWMETSKALRADRLSPFVQVLFEAGALRAVLPALHTCWHERGKLLCEILDDAQRPGTDRLLVLLATATSASGPLTDLAGRVGMDARLRKQLLRYAALEVLLDDPCAEALMKWLEQCGAFRDVQAVTPHFDLAKWRRRVLGKSATEKLLRTTAHLTRVEAATRGVLALDLSAIVRSSLPGQEKGKRIRAERLAVLGRSF